MAYAMKFNIANKLDIEALNRRIDSPEFSRDFYIFMSPDTLEDMPQLDDFDVLGLMCNHRTGRIGSYRGHKVFSDPSMKYGDVELR